jgi:hypothetical protein
MSIIEGLYQDAINYVAERPRTGVELATHIASHIDIDEEELCGITVQHLMQNMIDEGRLVELEYISPDMNYRVKSMFFTPGAILRVNDNSKR